MSRIKKKKKKFLNRDFQFPPDYEKKRLKGENDSPICTLIRNDSIDEFIIYVKLKLH